MAVARERATLEREIHAALRQQHEAEQTQAEMKILGIGGPTVPGAQALRFRERQILVDEMKRHGVDVSKTAHESLQQIVAEMNQWGIDIPKATVDSLHKINAVLAHDFLPTEVRTNIRDRLKQIQDTLKGGTGGAIDTYHAVSSEALTAGLGLTGDARKLAEERYAQALAHRGFAPSGPAALGQGVTITGDIHLHGVQPQNLQQLASELEKLARSSPRRGHR